MSCTRLKKWPKSVKPEDQVATRQDEGVEQASAPAGDETRPPKAPKAEKSGKAKK